MHKLTKNSINPRGFTLIEIVLVMAILMILLSAVFGTFYIINTSHAKVAVINDAKDYACLNMSAIENSIINAKGIILDTATNKFPLALELGYTSLYFDNGTLKNATSSTAVTTAFSYPQYTVSTSSGNKPKWNIIATYSRNADCTLKVNLKIVDNSTGVVFYTLEKDILFLNITNPAFIVDNASNIGSVVKFINYSY